jgi:hypothetical protein
MVHPGDLERRVDNRVQISTDGLPSYIRAVEDAFGSKVDYDQVVKFYDAEPVRPGHYAPLKVSNVEKEVIEGNPDMRTLSTSIVERQNHNMRMSAASRASLTASQRSWTTPRPPWRSTSPITTWFASTRSHARLERPPGARSTPDLFRER